MIPVQPFTIVLYCERHRANTDHTIQFMSYMPDKRVVNFMATCCECEEEAYDDDDEMIIGFTASLPVWEWDKITPKEDDIVFN